MGVDSSGCGGVAGDGDGSGMVGGVASVWQCGGGGEAMVWQCGGWGDGDGVVVSVWVLIVYGMVVLVLLVMVVVW